MSNPKRLKAKDLPAVRDELSKEQGNKCALCGIDLAGVTACLDHNHKTGAVRSVLCLNCNGIEGRIFNLARRAKRNMTESGFVGRLLDYWRNDMISVPRWLHPNHRTDEEKRIARNKKARLRRLRKKSK